MSLSVVAALQSHDRSLGIVEVYTMRGRALCAAICGLIGAGLVASCEPPRAGGGVAVSDSAGLRITNITTRPTDILLESFFVRLGIERLVLVDSTARGSNHSLSRTLRLRCTFSANFPRV